MITLPPISRDEYRHLMRLLGAAGDIGPRSLGRGLTGNGAIDLRARLSLVDPDRVGNAPLASHPVYD